MESFYQPPWAGPETVRKQNSIVSLTGDLILPNTNFKIGKIGFNLFTYRNRSDEEIKLYFYKRYITSFSISEYYSILGQILFYVYEKIKL